MGKRNADGSWSDSCLDRIKPGEPFFVLRAQDLTADELVDIWAVNLEMRAEGLFESNEPERSATIAAKAAEARTCAQEMRKWPTRKLPD